MADDANDVLMTFLNGANGVPAECQAVWAPADAMKMDFTTGNFFEIESFTFGGGLESEDDHTKESGNGGSTSSSGEGGNRLSGRGNTTQTGSSTGNPQNSKKSDRRGNKFSNYILQGSLRYPIDLQEISINRQLDKASPVFLQSCLNLQPFTKAVIVKRKVVGNVQANMGANVEHRGFLRMEFKEPLITSVEWSDGENVKETLKFISRGVKVIYRPQKPDGSLGPAVEASWDPTRRLTGSGR